MSLDNFATPVVCILSGYFQHAFGPKIVSSFSFNWNNVTFSVFIEGSIVRLSIRTVRTGLFGISIYKFTKHKVHTFHKVIKNAMTGGVVYSFCSVHLWPVL